VLRKSKEVSLTVTPERLKETVTKDNLFGDKPDPEMANMDVMGISIEALSKEVRRTYKIPSETNGVRVLSVNSRSPAAGKLREGDIIEQINFEDIASPQAFKDAVKAAEDEQLTVTFLVNRDGNYIFFSFDFV